MENAYAIALRALSHLLDKEPASHTASGQSNAAAQEETRLGGDVVGGGHSGRLACLGFGMREVKNGAALGVRPRLVLDAEPRCIGVQVLDRHQSVCGLLDGHAVVKAGLATGVAVLPLTNLRIALRAYTFAKLGDRK